jgi:hypothetical protein
MITATKTLARALACSKQGGSRDLKVVQVKKTVIIAKLVSESDSVGESQVVREIVAEARILWAANIERATITRNL